MLRIINKILAILVTVSITIIMASCSIVSNSNQNLLKSFYTLETLKKEGPHKVALISEEVVIEGLRTEGLQTEGLQTEGLQIETLKFEDVIVEDLQIERLIIERLENESIITEVKSASIRFASSSKDYYDKNDFYGYEYVDIGAIANKLAVGAEVLFVRVVLQKSGMVEPIECLLMTVAKDMIIDTVGGVFGGAAATIDPSGRLSTTLSLIVAITDAIIATVIGVSAIATGGISILFGALTLALAYSNDIPIIITSLKQLIETPNSEIDWSNINWNKLGYTTAKEMAESMADGFMFASLSNVLRV